MKKVLLALSILVMAAMACQAGAASNLPQTPVAPTAMVIIQTVVVSPPTDEPRVITATPVVSPTAAAVCQPIAITNLVDRPSATVNGTPIRLQVRDLNSCPRPLFYNETGVAQGTNYTLDLPVGWAAIIAPTTVAVHREGGTQQNYVNQEVVVIHGSFVGGAGVYEGAIRVVPEEWIDQILSEVLPIQEVQAGHAITVVHIR
ncbi:MAG: hypothetical protein WC744_01715 [Patescibacteria group bacterium]